MSRLLHAAGFGLAGLLAGILLTQPIAPAAAQGGGCQPELSGKVGSQVSGQLFERRGDGSLAPLGGPAVRLQARSGQILRLYIRPLAGPAQPSGAGCPVKVEIGELDGVARLLTREGFIFAGDAAYGQFRVGEERTLDFELKPFEEWSSPTEDLELETLFVELPEALEFLASLPAPASPPVGTICADVVYPDAQPAVGVVLSLRVPLDAPPDQRPAGADGRVCWDGYDDERLFGEVGVDPAVPTALGQSRSRYVSPRANYRLFVVKRAR